MNDIRFLPRDGTIPRLYPPVDTIAPALETENDFYTVLGRYSVPSANPFSLSPDGQTLYCWSHRLFMSEMDLTHGLNSCIRTPLCKGHLWCSRPSPIVVSEDGTFTVAFYDDPMGRRMMSKLNVQRMQMKAYGRMDIVRDCGSVKIQNLNNSMLEFEVCKRLVEPSVRETVVGVTDLGIFKGYYRFLGHGEVDQHMSAYDDYPEGGKSRGLPLPCDYDIVGFKVIAPGDVKLLLTCDGKTVEAFDTMSFPKHLRRRDIVKISLIGRLRQHLYCRLDTQGDTRIYDYERYHPMQLMVLDLETLTWHQTSLPVESNCNYVLMRGNKLVYVNVIHRKLRQYYIGTVPSLAQLSYQCVKRGICADLPFPDDTPITRTDLYREILWKRRKTFPQTFMVRLKQIFCDRDYDSWEERPSAVLGFQRMQIKGKTESKEAESDETGETESEETDTGEEEEEDETESEEEES